MVLYGGTYPYTAVQCLYLYRTVRIIRDVVQNQLHSGATYRIMYYYTQCSVLVIGGLGDRGAMIANRWSLFPKALYCCPRILVLLRIVLARYKSVVLYLQYIAAMRCNAIEKQSHHTHCIASCCAEYFRTTRYLITGTTSASQHHIVHTPVVLVLRISIQVQ